LLFYFSGDLGPFRVRAFSKIQLMEFV
jgi:hypothetical protein